MCCLREVDDPRKPSNGTLHDFVEILVIAMAAVLSDCDTVEDIAYWAHVRRRIGCVSSCRSRTASRPRRRF
jgi:hypothetical protein